MILGLFLVECSEDLQTVDEPGAAALAVLSETEESEPFARDLGNLEVYTDATLLQVVVTFSTINFASTRHRHSRLQ